LFLAFQYIQRMTMINQGEIGTALLESEIRDMSVLAGKYLTFELGDEGYGIEILKVREIIGLMEITKVPNMPHYVRGVINLRGKIHPVVDLHSKFGMGTTENTNETCIIVVDVAQNGKPIMVGILVDAVSEVLDITVGELEATPQFNISLDSQFIMGIAKIKDEIKILLEIDQVLADGMDLM
jgi:purine-binding chemotaxis protein CheW